MIYPYRANLNKSYFTNRQDRYLYFTSSPRLSDYCVSFLKLFSGFSYQLFPSKTDGTHIFQWPNPKIDVENLGSSVRQCILNFHSSQRGLPRDSDTLIFPIIQAGYMDIRQEEHCLDRLFFGLSHLPNARSSFIDLTSGYFALHKRYQDLLIDSPVNFHVLAAGPKVGALISLVWYFSFKAIRRMVFLVQKVYPAEFQKGIFYSYGAFGSAY